MFTTLVYHFFLWHHCFHAMPFHNLYHDVIVGRHIVAN